MYLFIFLYDIGLVPFFIALICNQWKTGEMRLLHMAVPLKEALGTSLEKKLVNHILEKRLQEKLSNQID